MLAWRGDEPGENVAVSRRAEDINRVFLPVGVEIADDQHVGINRDKRIGDERQKRLRLAATSGVEASLAVSLIGVRARRAATAFRAKMIDGDDEFFARGDLLESLGDRVAAVSPGRARRFGPP